MTQKEIEIFAKNYVQAWCSGDPENVASFFASQGSSSDNGEPAAVGREAIAQSIGKLMLAFPDMVVTLDNLLIQSDNVEFHWTLSGTNTGPNGTGNKVKIKGVDFWKIDDDGLIQESQGSFDVEEFKRQIEQGC